VWRGQDQSRLARWNPSQTKLPEVRQSSVASIMVHTVPGPDWRVRVPCTLHETAALLTSSVTTMPRAVASSRSGPALSVSDNGVGYVEVETARRGMGLVSARHIPIGIDACERGIERGRTLASVGIERSAARHDQLTLRADQRSQAMSYRAASAAQ
jgi:hypothetical protein